MVKRPTGPFKNAAQNEHPPKAKLQAPLDLNPPRDKDNAAPELKPTGFHLGGSNRPNQAPLGTVGTKLGLNATNGHSPALQSIKDQDPKPIMLIDGRFLDQPDYDYHVVTDDFRSIEGLEGGKITALEVSHGGKIMAQFKDTEWTREPTAPEAKAMVQRLQDRFGDVERDFKPIAPPDQSHDRDR